MVRSQRWLKRAAFVAQILEDGQRMTFSSGLRTVGVFGGEGTMQQQVCPNPPDFATCGAPN
jgi:hypothetical protein